MTGASRATISARKQLRPKQLACRLDVVSRTAAEDEGSTEVIDEQSADLAERIAAIDLSMIKVKLQDPEEGAGWSVEYAEMVEAEYRKFLCLTGWYPDHAIVPSKIIDTFWHAHILDTQAYAPDCERSFGFFLHHFPYFGMRGPEDAAQLGDAYDGTLELYEQHFGTVPADLWARTGAARCPNCGVRCKKVIFRS
jgi:hypothetical protein